MKKLRGISLCGAVLAAALAATGCAQPVTSHPGPGHPGPVPGSSAPASAGCATTAATTLTVSDTDSGATECLAPGAHLSIYLHGSADRRWAPLQLAGSALAPAPNGRGTLAIGVTGGFYVAAAPGTVHLTSQQPACTGQVMGGASTGPCDARQFTLTVVVG